MVDMDELISRSIEGRTAEPDEARLLAWRRASRESEAHYQEVRRLLRAVESAMAAEPVPPPPSVQSVVARARRRREAGPRGRVERSRWVWGIGSLGAAVAAAILVMFLSRSTEPEFNYGKGEFVTGAAETATLVLADGTLVRLAPHSRLQIPGVRGSREVFLDGQAFFAVAKMPGYPFRVRTKAGEARVLGTRFEIRTDDEDLRVVVLEGRVALETGSEQVEVGVGEMGLISDGSTSAPVKVDDVRPLIPWLERFLVFQSTPLREVAVELEREYGTRVEVTDSALAELTVTGWYADKSLEEVIAIVCGAVRAECSIQDGVARIERRQSQARALSGSARGEVDTPRTEDQ
jgi:transmembrane sensor